MRIRALALFLLLAASTGCKHGGGRTPVVTPTPTPKIPAVAGSPTTPVDLQEAYSWLFEGSAPTQVGVVPGTIQRQQMCLLHGQVVDEGQQPLAGVRVEVVGSPELGHTLSTANGAWTLAVNGGMALEVRMTAAGRAPSQRQFVAGWRGQYNVEPVVLVPRTGSATPVRADAAVPQMVLGEVVNDTEGRRRAMLFVPPGTTAAAELPNGQRQNLPVFTVRSTEFTVGAEGEARMPADFAGNIAYTYAIEYVCDEAEALGAVSVHFNKPLVHYVENFLDFPVGTPVPTGFYDKVRKAWVAANDGLVVKVLNVTNGSAVLDLLGEGQPATPAQLTALGVSAEELQRLGGVHAAGTELWRVRLEHFTPWDCNFPYGPPANAEPPQMGIPGNGQLFDAATEDQDTACGSIVLVQDQVLVESVELPGTGMRMVYRSDRAAGYRSRTRVALTGDTLPPGLKRVELVAEIGGRWFFEQFPPTPRLVHELVWDGLDWRGSRLQGRQRATIMIGYVYDATYQQPAELQRSFGQFSGVPMTGNRSRREITLWQQMRGQVGGFDARGLGMGGWTLDANHVYDAEARLLLRGDGTTIGRSAHGDVVDTFAGTPQTPGFEGENGPALAAKMNGPTDVRVGPDGAVYFIESLWLYGAPQSALRRIGQDGTITTIAGGASSGFGGDGGPATAALFRAPHQFDFAPDGSIWIADTLNHCIRRVGTDGIVQTVAGTPETAGFSGDDGPATGARFHMPMGLAVATDGSVYIADQYNHRIRRIGMDGTITTILGTNAMSMTGDGGPASQASAMWPDSVAVDRRGNVYFTDLYAAIRCIGVDGIVRRIAGTGITGHDGDDGPALQARISAPNGLHIGLDGSIYFAEYDRHCIRRISPAGTITTCFGMPGQAGFSGDGRKATLAKLLAPNAVCQAPDGTFYIAESGNHIIRRVRSPWPGFGSGEKVVVEADGSALHVFDLRGRHLRTESAVTTDKLVECSYDAAGRLVTVATQLGQVQLERDANGLLLAVVSPGGKRTVCRVDAEGGLARLQTPDGRALDFTYDAKGLLTRIRFADGREQTFAYDAQGRLTQDADGSGRSLALSRSLAWDREEVQVTMASGRVQTYETRPGTAPGDELRIRTDCCTRTETLRSANGTTEVLEQNGVVARQTLQDDPVFGGEVRGPATLTVTIPGDNGTTLATLFASYANSATLADPKDPRSIETMTSTVESGVRTWRQEFDRTAGTIRRISPSGRTSTSHFDEHLRIVREERAGGPPTELSYDTRGLLQSVQQTVGSRVRRTTFEYDGDGNLVRMLDPNGETLAPSRDANDRLVGLSANGLTGPSLRYDGGAKLVGVVPPGRSEHQLGRDVAGRLTSYTPPGGAAVRFQLDVDGAVTGVDLAGEQSLTVLRQAGSTRVTGLAVAAPRVPGNITFAYHQATGQLASATTPEGVVTSYTHYGSLPRGVQTVVPGATPPAVGYGYDSRLQMWRLTVGSQTFSHFYDDDGLLRDAGDEDLVRDPQSGFIMTRHLGSCSVVHDYDDDGFPEIDRLTANRLGTTLFANGYDRDLAARITRLRDLVANVATDYGYDSRGRLRSVTVGGVLRNDLTFDDNGNPVRDLVTGRTFTTDGQDRLVAAGNVSYQYDAAGRLRLRQQGGQDTAYTYDVFGNLLRVQLPTGRVVDYLVDAQNQRTRRSADGTVTHVFVHGADGRLLAESRSGGAWRYYIYASRHHVPDYLHEGSTRFLLVHDHLGSVRRVVNTSTGAVVQSMDYDAWGNVLADTNPGFQPFGWSGGL